MSDGTIFVSYRKSDAGAMAAMIHAALKAEFGDRVFFDNESLHRGDNWRDKIEANLANTVAMVLVFGKEWVKEFAARQTSGEPDVHKHELQVALRHRIPLLIVKLDGTEVPKKEELPRVLRRLVFEQCQVLPAVDFSRHVKLLIEDLHNVLRQRPEPPEENEATARITVTVEPFGDGDYLDIAEAVREVPLFSTILVRPGVYTDRVVIERTVQIDCPAGDVVLKVEDGPALAISAASGRIRGLEVVSAAPKNGVGVEITSGRVTLEDCRISADTLAGSIGVLVRGEATRPTLRSCTISRIGTGVVVRDDASGRFESCTVGEVDVGVEVVEHGDPVFHGLHVLSANQDGVRVHQAGRGTFQDLEVENVKDRGIFVTFEGDPLVSGATVHDAGVVGVGIGDGGHGTFERCEIHAAPTGVLVSDDGAPVFTATRIHHVATGVGFTTRGRGTWDGLEMSDITARALEVESGCDPTMRNVAVATCPVAVMIEAEGRGTFEHWTIRGTTGIAIDVDTAGEPVFRDVSLSGLSGNGIRSRDGGRGLFEDCTIEGAETAGKKYPAVVVRSQAEPVFRRLTIRGGSSHGVWVLKGGRGSFVDIELSGMAEAAVAVEEGAAPTMSRFDIHDVPAFGVGIIGAGSGGTFEDGSIHDLPKEAVVLGDGGDGTFRRVVISDVGSHGVLVTSAGLGTFEDCEVTRTLGSAFKTRAGGNPTVRRARIHRIGVSHMPQPTGSVKRGRSRLKAWYIEAHGIQVGPKGLGTFIDCEMASIHDAAVAIAADGRGHFEGCTVDGAPFGSA